MLQFIFGVFLVLHGLVHLLYYGQSARRFELRPDMTWPDGSWAFSRLLGERIARNLASVACVLAAILFVAGGAGALISQPWWQPISVAAAVFSTVTFVVFWNGKLRTVSDQGGVGILTDLAILVAVLVLRWPPS
jgi:hypothetical protein